MKRNTNMPTKGSIFTLQNNDWRTHRRWIVSVRGKQVGLCESEASPVCLSKLRDSQSQGQTLSQNTYEKRKERRKGRRKRKKKEIRWRRRRRKEGGGNIFFFCKTLWSPDQSQSYHGCKSKRTHIGLFSKITLILGQWSELIIILIF